MDGDMRQVPDSISYDKLMELVRKKLVYARTHAERDYYHELWYDLLILDSQLKTTNESRTEPTR